MLANIAITCIVLGLLTETCSQSSEGTQISQEETDSCAEDEACVATVRRQITAQEIELSDLRDRIGEGDAVSCHMNTAGVFTVEPMLHPSGSSTSFNISYQNLTSIPEGMTRFNVYLSPGEDSEIMVAPGSYGMFLHIFSKELSEEMEDLKEMFTKDDLTDMFSGVNFWTDVAACLVAIIFLCLCIGIMAALEAKFQCVGGNQLHHMVEEQRKISEGIHQIMDLMGVAGPGDDEEDEMDEDGQPKPKKSPLENPVMRMLIVRALENAGVQSNHTSLVIHTLNKMNSSPKETIMQLGKGGVVPKDMADKALAAKTSAKGAVQDGVAATKARAQEEGEKLSERKSPSMSVSVSIGAEQESKDFDSSPPDESKKEATKRPKKKRGGGKSPSTVQVLNPMCDVK